MYVSPLTSPILAEATVTHEDGQPLRLGYVPRWHEADPNHPAECCEAFPRDLLIPRSDWRNIIEMQERTKSTLTHVRARAGIRTLSQNGTNYCWCFGVVNAVRIVIALQGGGFRNLSPTAVAAQVKNFRNVGGNTFQAIPHIAEKGVPTVEFWPLNQIDRKYLTPAMQANAQLTRLAEWYELQTNSFDAAASALLRGWPVPMGLSWWSHLVCGLRLVALDGRDRFGIEIENSHGESYGNKGLAVLPEEKATAFDQAALRVVTPTEK